MNSLDAALQFALASQLQARRLGGGRGVAAARLRARPVPPGASACRRSPGLPGPLPTPAPCASCASPLQGVVAEASSVLGRLREAVTEFHRQDLAPTGGRLGVAGRGRESA